MKLVYQALEALVDLSIFVISLMLLPSDGRSRGLLLFRKIMLLLFWKNDENIDVLSYLAGHVDVVLKPNEEHQFCYITLFYGNPKPHLRHLSWQLLQRIG